ncbi:MAG: type I restriction-modification system subunit M [Patescibacteria group bacterium]
MSDQHKKQLETQLWNIADVLRGKMNADEYRDYILGFIFYKYLSEKIENTANKMLIADKLKFSDLNRKMDNYSEYIEAVKHETLEELGFFLEPSELFANIAKKGINEEEGVSNFIIEDLQSILTNIQQSTLGAESEEDFENLFEDMDLNSSKLGKSVDDRNLTIAKILNYLAKIDFQLDDTSIDVLGDAYEYLIGQFAAGAGKKAGEFYTPQQVSSILAKIVTTDKNQLDSVYDPTCGSGSLLLRVAKEVSSVNNFYGQELNRTTYNLCRMNMILHGVSYRDFDIKLEDTLERPQHVDLQFEAIVANPPFSANWSASKLFEIDPRFTGYGKLAPSSKADYAFVQHMIHHLKENGTMAIILPHGALFRGGAELTIRQYLIEKKNYLDAVIGLPANIFYGTSIPTCIMVFKKCRKDDQEVLFIDASNEFEKIKTQNFLTKDNINKIINTYRSREEIAKYSHNGSLQEIADNNFNLNIPRYVDTFEEEEQIDIEQVSQEIKAIDKEILENMKVIEVFCKELGISTPF